MPSAKSFAKEQEACNLQTESWVPLLAPGLATTAHGEIITETGGHVLTHGPVAELARAGIMTATMRNHMP